MQDQGLTQESLASRLGVSQAAVSRWIRGSQPRPAQALRLAHALGVRSEWLLRGEGQKLTHEQAAADKQVATHLGLAVREDGRMYIAEPAAPIRAAMRDAAKILRDTAAALAAATDRMNQLADSLDATPRKDKP